MNEDELFSLAREWGMQIDYLKMCIIHNGYSSYNYSIFHALAFAQYNFNECVNQLIRVVSPEVLRAAQTLVLLKLQNIK
jgi:hypothetical protein